MKRLLRDNRGQRYQMKVLQDSDDLYHLELRDLRGEYVGKAVMCRLGLPGAMELSEICIRDDNDPPKNFIESAMRNSARFKGVAKSYRRRGLGSALLKQVVEHAREKSLKRIYGAIIEEDIARTPDLLTRYERRGFRKCDRYPCSIRKAVAFLCMELS